jgi:hypothetical protein
LADEVIDRSALMLSAALGELKAQHMPLPPEMLKQIQDLADTTPEACRVSADALSLAITDEDGYDARRFRSEGANLRRLASMLDVIAEVLDYEREFPPKG